MKTKTKVRPKPKPKPKKLLAVIPAAYRSYVLKKFRCKDGRRVAVVGDGGRSYRILSFGLDGTEATIREFPLTGRNTVIPESVWQPVELELAKWVGRFFARHSELPSTKRERGRRRKMMKKQLPGHQAHMETKTLLRAASGEIKPTPADPVPKLETFVIVYDPKQKLEKGKYFRVHAAGCERLANDRRRVQKKGKKKTAKVSKVPVLGGCSWVLEANSAEIAIALQVREFDEDDKGYDAKDFAVHSCV